MVGHGYVAGQKLSNESCSELHALSPCNLCFNQFVQLSLIYRQRHRRTLKRCEMEDRQRHGAPCIIVDMITMCVHKGKVHGQAVNTGNGGTKRTRPRLATGPTEGVRSVPPIPRQECVRSHRIPPASALLHYLENFTPPVHQFHRPTPIHPPTPPTTPLTSGVHSSSVE